MTSPGAGLGGRYGNPGVPSRQDPPLGVAGRVRRKGRAKDEPIRSVPAQLQELPEGFTLFHQPPTGLYSGFSVRVYSHSLRFSQSNHKAVVVLQQVVLGYRVPVAGKRCTWNSLGNEIWSKKENYFYILFFSKIAPRWGQLGQSYLALGRAKLRKSSKVEFIGANSDFGGVEMVPVPPVLAQIVQNEAVLLTHLSERCLIYLSL